MCIRSVLGLVRIGSIGRTTGNRMGTSLFPFFVAGGVSGSGLALRLGLGGVDLAGLAPPVTAFDLIDWHQTREFIAFSVSRASVCSACDSCGGSPLAAGVPADCSVKAARSF